MSVVLSGGLSPNLVMEQYRGDVRRVDPDVLEIICTRPIGKVKVTRDGVRVDGHVYGNDDPDVWNLQGRTVVVRIDPHRGDAVTLWSETGEFLCTATNRRMSGATREDLRKAAQKRGKFRREAKQALKSRDFLLKSNIGQVMQVKTERARAAEETTRRTLPTPPRPAVSIVRPDLVPDAKRAKSMHAQAFARERSGVVVIRVDQGNRDARGVTSLLCVALTLIGVKTHRERLAAIKSHLAKRRNIVIIVDEAQKLTADGLEILRDIHDASDPESRRNTPIVFLGDRDFYRLIVKARNGQPSPIKPQMTRRMYPVLDIGAECADEDGDLYTVQDIVRILRNDRLRRRHEIRRGARRAP